MTPRAGRSWVDNAGRRLHSRKHSRTDNGPQPGRAKGHNRAFCAARGWTLAEVYTDAGCSGGTGKRPGLVRLMADVDAGRLDVVVVHAMDRFWRNLRGLLRALDALINHANVSFLSITENLDFTTSWGKLTLAVLGSLAEIYLDKLSAEVGKGKRDERPRLEQCAAFATGV